jgi:DNA-binding CsgD family transcriptional regulator
MKQESGSPGQIARLVSPDPLEPRPVDHLERAREACDHKAWRDAHEAYLAADAAVPLAGDDLDRLALAACLVGRERDFLAYKERSHRAHVAANRLDRAARDAYWLALLSMLRGEVAQSNAWTARGERLIADRDCVERGYLQLCGVEQVLRGGDCAGAYTMAVEAITLGERFNEPDLVASARHMQGRAAINLGRVSQGVKLLDETMLSVVAGELSPIITGLMYCSIIDACREAYDLNRAREWTAAMSRWCDRQGGMVAFAGTCVVHRAEILCLQGAWADAIAETRRVCERDDYCDRPPPGGAFYQQGEIHRLRGEATLAEECYRTASRRGYEPQPGLALLRFAQGRTDAASAAMRRLMGGTQDRAARGRILPAYFEIMLGIGDLPEAQRACEELEALCAVFETEVVRAQAAHARGALRVRSGDAQGALMDLRESFQRWEHLEAPYEAARVRVFIAEACAALGDEEARDLELDASRFAFEQLGARFDLDRLDACRAEKSAVCALTSRELQVLERIAQGHTNKSIARELGLSARTIDRHVSNILAKLNVSSRSAATAYACAKLPKGTLRAPG